MLSCYNQNLFKMKPSNKPKKPDLKSGRIISPEEAKKMQAIPFDADNDDTRREKACEGKQESEICRWTSVSGVDNVGLCKDPWTPWKPLRCEGQSGSGSSSGSGSGETLSPKILACEGKNSGAECYYEADNGRTIYGKCILDASHFDNAWLACSSLNRDSSNKNSTQTDQENEKL